ncbi:MAG: PEP-CTERM sorting domain-containing protein [Gammaproteobacteria bacterium]|nr:PEP-CTERM sorting domain-containing protein [Gammaproteobacteria bacterium]
MSNFLTIIGLSLISLTAQAGIIPPTPIPEPSSMALFGAAAIAVIVARKLRK